MEGFQAMSVEVDIKRSRFRQFGHRAIAKKWMFHSTPNGKICHFQLLLM
jgi:hypothetical protein